MREPLVRLALVMVWCAVCLYVPDDKARHVALGATLASIGEMFAAAIRWAVRDA